MAAGWIDEVRRLRQSPRPPGREAAQASGYPELNAFLDGLRPLDETVAAIKTRSRQFAKRQLTWFRNLPGMEFATGKLTAERWTGRMT